MTHSSFYHKHWWCFSSCTTFTCTRCLNSTFHILHQWLDNKSMCITAPLQGPHVAKIPFERESQTFLITVLWTHSAPGGDFWNPSGQDFSNIAMVDHCCVYNMVSKSTSPSVVAEDSRLLQWHTRVIDKWQSIILSISLNCIIYGSLMSWLLNGSSSCFSR